MTESDVLLKPLEAFTPLAVEVLEHPVAFNARLRAEAPVYRCPHTGIVFVSDYATITAVARDPATFSNRFGAAMRNRENDDPRLAEVRARSYPAVDTMLTQDPPQHRRYRGMVNQAFTSRRVALLEPHIEALCHELIDGFIGDGQCEFVGAFAKRLPMTVIAEQLGVPLSDYELFKSWSDAFVAQLSGLASAEQELAAARQIADFQQYFAATIEQRRQRPADDIISDIVHARFENERPLEMAEMLSILQQLLVAGNETTTHAISEGVLLLVGNPAAQRQLRAQPALIANFVEEVLRLSSPTANMWRVATRDTELGGVGIPAGTLLQIRFASGNRDQQVFAEPDELDLERANAKANIAFGHGVHMCIGASLARKELEVAFRIILERLDAMALDCEPEELIYAPNMLLRGLSALPLSFESRNSTV